MTLDDRNVIRRFILLVINIYYKQVDELYNNKTKLYCSAQVNIDNLFKLNHSHNQSGILYYYDI